MSNYEEFIRKEEVKFHPIMSPYIFMSSNSKTNKKKKNKNKTVTTKYNLVDVHTPVLTVTLSECCASVVGGSVIVEDEVISLPLVTVYDPVIVQQSRKLLA